MEHFFVSTSSHIKTLTPKSDTYVPYISCGEVLKTFFEYRAICEQHKCM